VDSLASEEELFSIGLLLLLLLLLFVITYIQVIYRYVPEANHVSWVYIVALILVLQFMTHAKVLLEFIIIIIIIIIVSCHRPFLPGTFLEPAVIPTAQTSSFTLQNFPYYV